MDNLLHSKMVDKHSNTMFTGEGDIKVVQTPVLEDSANNTTHCSFFVHFC